MRTNVVRIRCHIHLYLMIAIVRSICSRICAETRTSFPHDLSAVVACYLLKACVRRSARARARAGVPNHDVDNVATGIRFLRFVSSRFFLSSSLSCVGLCGWCGYVGVLVLCCQSSEQHFYLHASVRMASGVGFCLFCECNILQYLCVVPSASERPSGDGSRKNEQNCHTLYYL